MRWFKKKDSVEQRVTRGMHLLDKDRPGWHRRINLGSLNIARSDSCALGQTYGSYGAGMVDLRITTPEAIDHGFQVPRLTLPGNMRDEFDALTEEWRRQIEARLDDERAKWAEQVCIKPRRHRKVGSNIRW